MEAFAEPPYFSATAARSCWWRSHTAVVLADFRSQTKILPVLRQPDLIYLILQFFEIPYSGLDRASHCSISASSRSAISDFSLLSSMSREGFEYTVSSESRASSSASRVSRDSISDSTFFRSFWRLRARACSSFCCSQSCLPAAGTSPGCPERQRG